MLNEQTGYLGWTWGVVRPVLPILSINHYQISSIGGTAEMTRHEAVVEHRKMWTWIKEQLEGMSERESKVTTTCDLKREYYEIHEEELRKKYGDDFVAKYSFNYCFLCTYNMWSREIGGYGCVNCPVRINAVAEANGECLNGLYEGTTSNYSLKTRIKAARIISKLPENKNAIDIDI